MPRKLKLGIFIAVVWGLVLVGLLILIQPSMSARISRSMTAATAGRTSTPIDLDPGAPTPEPTSMVSLETSGGGRVSGMILDQSGKPIPGALALLSLSSGATHYAHSTAEGQYEIAGVPAGMYTVVCAKPDYQLASLQNISVDPGQVRSHVDFILSRSQGFDRTAAAAGIQSIQLRSKQESSLVQSETYELQAVDNRFQVAFYSPHVVSDPRPLIIAIWPNEIENGGRLWEAMAEAGYLVAVFQHSLNVDREAQRILTTLSLMADGRFDVEPDLERIGIYAASSGSITANLVIQQQPDLKALVLSGAITDLFSYRFDLMTGGYAQALDHGAGVQFRILGDPQITPEDYLRYSMFFNAENVPPSLIVHATNDYLVPVDQAYRFAQELNAIGRINEVYLIDDASHYLLPFGIRNPEQEGTDLSWAVINFYSRILE